MSVSLFAVCGCAWNFDSEAVGETEDPREALRLALQARESGRWRTVLVETPTGVELEVDEFEELVDLLDWIARRVVRAALLRVLCNLLQESSA